MTTSEEKYEKMCMLYNNVNKYLGKKKLGFQEPENELIAQAINKSLEVENAISPEDVKMIREGMSKGADFYNKCVTANVSPKQMIRSEISAYRDEKYSDDEIRGVFSASHRSLCEYLNIPVDGESQKEFVTRDIDSMADELGDLIKKTSGSVAAALHDAEEKTKAVYDKIVGFEKRFSENDTSNDRALVLAACDYAVYRNNGIADEYNNVTAWQLGVQCGIVHSASTEIYKCIDDCKYMTCIEKQQKIESILAVTCYVLTFAVSIALPLLLTYAAIDVMVAVFAPALAQFILIPAAVVYIIGAVACCFAGVKLYFLIDNVIKNYFSKEKEVNTVIDINGITQKDQKEVNAENGNYETPMQTVYC